MAGQGFFSARIATILPQNSHFRPVGISQSIAAVMIADLSAQMAVNPSLSANSPVARQSCTGDKPMGLVATSRDRRQPLLGVSRIGHRHQNASGMSIISKVLS
jgi:hypothetical protein